MFYTQLILIQVFKVSNSCFFKGKFWVFLGKNLMAAVVLYSAALSPINSFWVDVSV